MNREQMVEKAADLIEQIGDCGSAARAVLDVILPQVTTVAELEALQYGVLLVDTSGWPVRWRGGGSDASYVIAVAEGPLTVVWQPETSEVSS